MISGGNFWKGHKKVPCLANLKKRSLEELQQVYQECRHWNQRGRRGDLLGWLSLTMYPTGKWYCIIKTQFLSHHKLLKWWWQPNDNTEVEDKQGVLPGKQILTPKWRILFLREQQQRNFPAKMHNQYCRVVSYRMPGDEKHFPPNFIWIPFYQTHTPNKLDRGDLNPFVHLNKFGQTILGFQ